MNGVADPPRFVLERDTPLLLPPRDIDDEVDDEQEDTLACEFDVAEAESKAVKLSSTEEETRLRTPARRLA